MNDRCDQHYDPEKEEGTMYQVSLSNLIYKARKIKIVDV